MRAPELPVGVVVGGGAGEDVEDPVPELAGALRVVEEDEPLVELEEPEVVLVHRDNTVGHRGECDGELRQVGVDGLRRAGVLDALDLLARRTSSDSRTPIEATAWSRSTRETWSVSIGCVHARVRTIFRAIVTARWKRRRSSVSRPSLRPGRYPRLAGVSHSAPAAFCRLRRLRRLGSRRYFGAVTAAKTPVPTAVAPPRTPKVRAASRNPVRSATPPGAAKPAVTAVPAAVPPLNVAEVRKKFRRIPGVTMIALGDPAVYRYPRAFPRLEDLVVDALGHEHPIDRHGPTAFALPQRLPRMCHRVHLHARCGAPGERRRGTTGEDAKSHTLRLPCRTPWASDGPGVLLGRV